MLMSSKEETFIFVEELEDDEIFVSANGEEEFPEDQGGIEIDKLHKWFW